jgi:phage FluMu protein Com
MKRKRYRPPVTVHCKTCDKKIDEAKVEFINIEEDFQGRDWMTFKCPDCKKVGKSFRYG